MTGEASVNHMEAPDIHMEHRYKVEQQNNDSI